MGKLLFLIKEKTVREYYREKRKFINGILEKAEKDRSQGKIRNFFKPIGWYKDFNPTLKAKKDSNGDTLIEPSDKDKKNNIFILSVILL